MIGTGMLAVPILSGSAAYAVKEFAGLRGSLAVKPRYRPTFYAIMVVSIVLGIAMNLVHIDPIHALFVTAVINGVVAPPLLVLIVMLGSDRRVMGRRVSGRLSRTLTWTACGVMWAAVVALMVTLIPH
jgi:Mn2+/Fe2+ NRAMP family transporter